MIYALLSLASAGDPAVLERAVREELARATELRLPDAPPPYFVSYDLLDGVVFSAFAEQGTLVSSHQEQHRNLRVEVRGGSPELDSSNFQAFGEPDGIVQRRLPVEDNLTALRREIWLATDGAYKQAIEQLSRKQASRRDDPTPRPPDRVPGAPVKANLPSPAIRATNEQELSELVGRLSGALARYPEIEVAQAIARDWQGRRLILTNEGTELWVPTGYTVVRVEGTARLDDGSTVTDSRSWVVRDMGSMPAEAELRAEVEDLGRWLVAMKSAPIEEDYLGPVIFEGPASYELFSQLLAAEISGTPPIEQESSGPLGSVGRPTARIGRRLLPDGWSVVDDPTHGGLGSYAFDHEGTAPRRVELVKGGVLRDLLMSRIPRKDLQGSTGHGRALGSDRRSAVPAAVTVSPKRLVSAKALRRAGLRLAAQTGREYVLVLHRLMPPALSESLDVGVSGEGPLPGLTAPYEAFRLYADGREEPVRGLGFSGVDRRALRDIARASAGDGPVDGLDGSPGAARFQIGPTGGFPVTWDVPTVLITEMELSGRGGGEPRVLPPVPRSAQLVDDPE